MYINKSELKTNTPIFCFGFSCVLFALCSRYVCVIAAHLTKFIRTCFYFFQVVTFLLALDLRKISDPFRFVFVLLLVAMFLLSIIS